MVNDIKLSGRYVRKPKAGSHVLVLASSRFILFLVLVLQYACVVRVNQPLAKCNNSGPVTCSLWGSNGWWGKVGGEIKRSWGGNGVFLSLTLH